MALALEAEAGPPSFQWTQEFKVRVLESLIFEDCQKVLRLKTGNLLDPLKMFACYLNFCKEAFKGSPPDNFTIEEYEKMLSQMTPQWVTRTTEKSLKLVNLPTNSLKKKV